jgi:hypothetical protein
MSGEKFPNIVLRKIVEEKIFEVLMGKEPTPQNKIDELQFFQEDSEEIRYSSVNFIKIKISKADNQDFKKILPGEIVVALFDLRDLWKGEFHNTGIEIYWEEEIALFGHFAKKNFFKMKLKKISTKKISLSA